MCFLQYYSADSPGQYSHPHFIVNEARGFDERLGIRNTRTQAPGVTEIATVREDSLVNTCSGRLPTGSVDSESLRSP